MTYRYPEYRIKVDGVVVAGSNSLADVARYVYQYLEEGQLTLEEKTEAGGRWKKGLTVPKIEEEDNNDTD